MVIAAVMQADHHRWSRLCHRFIEQTHASDSNFFSCVTKAESMCTAMNDVSCINEKAGERESNVRSQNQSVQSIVRVQSGAV